MPIVTDGLLAYYNSKQGVSGTKWTNIAPAASAANGIEATLQGAAVIASGMELSGTDIIKVPVPTTLSDTDGPFSWDMRVKGTNLGSTSNIWLMKFGDALSSTNNGLWYEGANMLFSLDVGTSDFLGYDSGSGNFNIDLNANQEYFLSFTFDPTSNIGTFYVDSILVGSVTYSTGSRLVGYGHTTIYLTGSLNGIIDNVKIYNKVLSQAEVTQNFNNGPNVGLAPEIITDGLLSYWNSKQGVTGSTWSNIAPSTTGTLNGTLYGSPSVGTDGMTFPSLSQLARLPISSSVKSGNFTFEIRTKLPYSTITEIIGVGDTSSTQNNLLGFSSVGATQFEYDVFRTSPFDIAEFYNFTPSDKTDNSEQYFSFTFTASTKDLRVYQNGVLLTTITTTATSFCGSTRTHLWINNGSTSVSGVVDGIRVYNRVLSDAEIANNYTVGPSVGLPPPPGVQNTVTLKDQIYPSDIITNSINTRGSTPDAIVTSGLIGYWHFAQGVSGPNWANIAPGQGGAPLAVISGPVLEVDGMRFDGVNDLATITAFNPPATRTIEVGIIPDNPIVAGNLFAKSTTERSYISSSTQFAMTTGNRTNTGTHSMTAGSFNQLVFGSNGSQTSLWSNGTNRVANGTANAPTTGAATWNIGGLSSSTFFDGKIVYVRVYNRLLTNTEVTTNWNNRANVGLAQASTSSLYYGKGFNEGVTLGDTVTQEYTPGTVEGQYSKSLSDSVSMSDDALTKTSTRFKDLADSVPTTDVPRGSINKSRIESITMLDSIVSLPNKFITDSISLSDTLTRSTVKPLADTIPLNDSSFKGTNMVMPIDSINNSDEAIPDYSQGTRSFTKSLSDSMAVSDLSVTKQTSTFKTVTDSIPTTDGITDKDTSRKLNDTVVSPTDAITNRASSRLLSDSVVSTDTFSKQTSFFKTVSLSDSVTAIDTFAKQSVQSKLLSDSVSGSDSALTKGSSRFKTVTDSIASTDPAITLRSSRFKSLADSITSSDSVTKQSVQSKKINDAISSTDSLSQQSSGFRSISLSDSIIVDDISTKVSSMFRSLSDSVVSTDSITKRLTFFRAVSDSISSSDSPTTRATFFKVLNDSTTFTDSLTKVFTGLKTLSDSTTLTDSLSVGSTLNKFLLLTDSVNVSDSFVKQISNKLLDFFTVSDTSTKGANRVYSDSVISTDAKYKQAIRTLSDSITSTDNPLLRQMAILKFDDLAIIDTYNQKINKTFTEAIILSDGVTRLAGKSINLNDSVNVTDTIRKAIFKIKSDNILTNDFTFISLMKKIIESLSPVDTMTKGKGRRISLNDSIGLDANTLIKAFDHSINDVLITSDTSRLVIRLKHCDSIDMEDTLSKFNPNAPTLIGAIQLGGMQDLNIYLIGEQSLDLILKSGYIINASLSGKQSLEVKLKGIQQVNITLKGVIE